MNCIFKQGYETRIEDKREEEKIDESRYGIF
jgi:hypothetical protein